MKRMIFLLVFYSNLTIAKQCSVKILSCTKIDKNHFQISCAIRNYFALDTTNQLNCNVLSIIKLKNTINQTDLRKYNIFQSKIISYYKNGTPIIKMSCGNSEKDFIGNFQTIHPDTLISRHTGNYLHSGKPFKFDVFNENTILEKAVFKDFIISIPEINLNYFLLQLEFKYFDLIDNEYVFIDNSKK
jgi:hypothetical protein